MKPFQIEQIVVAHLLRWGSRAAQVVFPYLKADKFVFDFGGGFGTDHAQVWRTLYDLHAHGKECNVTNASLSLPEWSTELFMLRDLLSEYYQIDGLNDKELRNYAEQVDKAGVVYNIAAASSTLAPAAQNPEFFEMILDQISDINEWSAQILARMSSSLTWESEGYESLGNIMPTIRAEWDAYRSGINTRLLDCGMPSLMSQKLIPLGKMAVLHGLSGQGKSTLALQYLLGVGIGLIANHVKGCVAVNSLEMDQQELVELLASTLARVDTSKFLDGSIKPEEIDRLEAWSYFAEKLPIFIDSTNFLTTSAMEYRASGLNVSEYGPVRLIVSDYGELFRDVGDSVEQRVYGIFRNQFYIAHSLNCAVLAISQSTASDDKTHIAGADGTRYSRGILQATDILLELHNPEAIIRSDRPYHPKEGINTSLAHVFIQKFRGALTGTRVELGWLPEYTMFYDLTLGNIPGEEKAFNHLNQALINTGMEHLIEQVEVVEISTGE